MKLFSLSLLILVLVACSSLPSSQTAQADADVPPSSYQASGAKGVELVKSLSLVFSDSLLKKYVQRALSNSPTKKRALEAFEEAGFNTKNSKSGLLPSLTFSGASSRSQSLTNNGVGNPSNFHSTSLDASWEVDVWGRIAAGVKASEQSEKASARDLEATMQSIAAQTTQAYFQLISAKENESVSQRRLDSLNKTLSLVSRRFESGTGDLGDLELAKSDVASARSSLYDDRDSRESASRTLSILMGDYPNASLTSADWPSLSRSIPAGLPSTLLMSRPDIIAAYERVRAADSSVKVAHRDLYPSFRLTSSGGRESTVLGDLLKGDLTVWSLAGSVSGPVFDAGARKAEVGAASARAKQALASYQSTVLNAFDEVESALGAERYLKQQQVATGEALSSAIRAEERILKSFESGLEGILSLLETQRRRFDAEERLTLIKTLRYQNRVSLALALGKAY